MINKLVPASRLTIIFILAVILSGSVLTYFSINNISNLKKLTEKRIIEEERELSARFSAEIQNKINKVTEGFENEINQSVLIKDSLIKRASEYDFIIQSFILKNDGQFLYPYFIGIPENLSEGKFSSRFKSEYRSGEEAEFVEKDPEKAKGFYISCLRFAIDGNDSVKALNALGRNSINLNKIEDATSCYNLNYFKLFLCNR